jgi:hypothetical protein
MSTESNTPPADDNNEIRLELPFDSHDRAATVADALTADGWEVEMRFVLEARASGPSEHLRAMHDRMKELAPRLGLV